MGNLGHRARRALLALSLGLGGCYASVVVSDGETDAGTARDASTDDATPDVFVFEGVVESTDGTPLEGANVALDPGRRARLETRSDATGAFRIEVGTPPASLDGIIALEGYAIVAFDGLSAAEVAELTEEPIELTPFEPPDIGERRNVIVAAAGVPRGGRWCVSIPIDVVRCQDPEAVLDRTYATSVVDGWPEHFYGYALGPDEELVDFVRSTWEETEDGGFTGTLVFDGVFDDEPEAVEWTVALPEDAESPFRTEDLDVELFF
ncbi:MAG: carboxypeptidase-like regulatory domain-containing protein, partial [Myxococcota bacterium]